MDLEKDIRAVLTHIGYKFYDFEFIELKNYKVLKFTDFTGCQVILRNGVVLPIKK